MPRRTFNKSNWIRLREALLDLLFPRQDLWTHEPMLDSVTGGKYLSATSIRYLRFIHAPVCDTCGFPLYGVTDGSDACQQCRHLASPAFESNRSMLLLNRLGRRIVHELKYHEGLYLLEDLAFLARNHASWDLSERVRGHQLVPVPLHALKLRERGYNQSLLLANVFAQNLGDSNTCVIDALIRTRATDSQTLMDRRTRMRNVRSAFAMRSDVCLDPNRPVTLVDDVFTTGSTIHACALTLRKAGVKTVRSLTLGHG